MPPLAPFLYLVDQSRAPQQPQWIQQIAHSMVSHRRRRKCPRTRKHYNIVNNQMTLLSRSDIHLQSKITYRSQAQQTKENRPTEHVVRSTPYTCTNWNTTSPRPRRLWPRRLWPRRLRPRRLRDHDVSDHDVSATTTSHDVNDHDANDHDANNHNDNNHEVNDLRLTIKLIQTCTMNSAFILASGLWNETFYNTSGSKSGADIWRCAAAAPNVFMCHRRLKILHPTIRQQFKR